MIEPVVNIRSIQHYRYCPHRFGLVEINGDWSINSSVAKANLIHNRVHENNSYKKGSTTVYTSVHVFNDNLGIYGVTDCLEFTPSENGQYIKDLDCNCNVSIVEYKPTKPKSALYNYEDAIQVVAQKLCVDSVFNCNSKVIIYYADVKKRIDLSQEDLTEFKTIILNTLDEIRLCLKEELIPPIRKSQKCSGCSMWDICLPTHKEKNNVRQVIFNVLENSNEEIT